VGGVQTLKVCRGGRIIFFFLKRQTEQDLGLDILRVLGEKQGEPFELCDGVIKVPACKEIQAKIIERCPGGGL
jgi:hypothetical protein